eukprot:scaffold5562_cov57-Cylindrotheca_fusiformis.AAC.2
MRTLEFDQFGLLGFLYHTCGCKYTRGKLPAPWDDIGGVILGEGLVGGEIHVTQKLEASRTTSTIIHAPLFRLGGNSSNRSNSFLFLTSSCMTTTTTQGLNLVTPDKVSLEGSRIQCGPDSLGLSQGNHG